MPFSLGRFGGFQRFCIGGALAALMAGAAATPVLAGDDGQAPIWKGIGDLVGLSSVAGEEKPPPIQYRERARLVLPPKMVLPPPTSPQTETATWPVDPEIAKTRKEKEAARLSQLTQSDTQDLRDGHRLPAAQLRADRSGPGQTNDRRCAAQSNSRGCDWIPFRNVLENVGLVKSDEVLAGQEPDRDWLTDPPKGYRVPSANTVATFDAKKNTNQSDPRSTLFVAPEQ